MANPIGALARQIFCWREHALPSRAASRPSPRGNAKIQSAPQVSQLSRRERTVKNRKVRSSSLRRTTGDPERGGGRRGRGKGRVPIHQHAGFFGARKHVQKEVCSIVRSFVRSFVRSLARSRARSFLGETPQGRRAALHLLSVAFSVCFSGAARPGMAPEAVTPHGGETGCPVDDPPGT